MREHQCVLNLWLAFALGILLASIIQLYWGSLGCDARIEEAIRLEEELNEVAPLPPRVIPNTQRRT